MDEIQKLLFERQDPEYREFHSRLMPTVEKNRVIGVRVPEIRKLAGRLAGTETAGRFLEQLPHRYYEENNLHGVLLEKIRDYDSCIRKVNEFLPYVDNWATCDLLSPPVFSRHLPELMTEIRRWIASGKTYQIRFGLGMLQRYFLDEEFRPEYLELAAGVHSEEYYVRMMTAWFFATALAKQYESTVPYLEENRLDPWVQNKTVQKARESFRISTEKKQYLKSLRRKRSGD